MKHWFSGNLYPLSIQIPTKRSGPLVAIPNLLDVDIQQAREHLEGLGLQVIVVLAKPNKKYVKADAGEVVAMVPRSGKVQPGSLIKLYYVDELVIEASKKEVALPDVTGLVLTEAQELLENLGYRVAAFPIKPRSQYASITVNQVISMSPNPRLNLTPVKKGNLIKLFFYHLSSLSRCLTKNILSSIVIIRKLFSFSTICQAYQGV